MASKILVGTASWSDPEFVRDWYPPGLRASERLPFYAQRFEMVELNSSFYSIPEAKLAEQWIRATPDHFTFHVKLHKLLSRHSCELKMLPRSLQRIAQTGSRDRVLLTPEIEHAAIQEFLLGIDPLEAAGKLGLLLLQLSPAFSPRAAKLEELESILTQLTLRPVAVELRNRNWMTGDQLGKTVQFFSQAGVTLVSVDAPASENFNVMPSTDFVTSPEAAYLRLHGRDAKAYLTGRTVASRFDYDYSDEELEEVQERVETLAEKVRMVHVIFNNNRSDYAPQAALRFRRIMGQAVPASPPPTQRTLDL